MRVLAGTSGFSYHEWKGSFYPSDLKADAMLAYYAERFRTVELNNTFYRLPNEKTLAQWAAQVPAEFRFALKASRSITHSRRLRDAEEATAYLFRVTMLLGARRGPILFGLPPNLKVDLPRLSAFLALIPSGASAAIEFRHESWHDDAVFALLRDHGVALCIAQTEAEETPLVATASWGYLRLRKEAYQAGELEDWAARIRAQDWTETFVFFKHEDAGVGPRLAAEFLTRFE